MNMNLGKNDFITMAGSVLAAIGAYMPMINVGGLGAVSYAEASSPGVYFLVLLALAASVVIFLDKRKFSLYAAVGAWLVLLWPVIKNMGPEEDKGMIGRLADRAIEPLQRVAGDLFGNILDFEIGGFAFLIGMILVLVGGVMNFRAAS